MLLDFIWDLYLCFCFPFLYISLVRSVRRWCFLWQTALIWKALWNPCRYGASQVISRYLDFKNPSHYAIGMLKTSWTCCAPHECPVPLRCTLSVSCSLWTSCHWIVLSEHIRKQQVAWQFLSEKDQKRWDAVFASWIYKGRNNLTAQNYMSNDCFLI